MVAGNVSHIVRGPGRIVINPSTAFATTAYPHGGTEIGLAKDVTMTPLGNSKGIWNEAFGEFTDILQATNHWEFECLLRGWDDDALTQLFPGNRAAGAVTQHGVFTFPGTRSPGESSVDGTDVFLAFVPDNLIHSDGLVLYRGIPQWTPDTELAFQRGRDFEIPLTVIGLRNTSGNIGRIGRMPDLGLT